jgi:hypothetical protein
MEGLTNTRNQNAAKINCHRRKEKDALQQALGGGSARASNNYVSSVPRQDISAAIPILPSQSHTVSDTIQQNSPSILAANQHRTPPTHIANYFAQFSPQFRYDPRGETWAQFYALRDYFGWEPQSEQLRREADDLRSAIVHEFNHIYGTDENDLVAWQTLCREVRVSPIPSTIPDCRRVSGPCSMFLVIDAHVT